MVTIREGGWYMATSSKLSGKSFNIFNNFFFNFFFNIYLFLGQRETEHERGWRGAEREGDTELETGSRL